MSAPLDGLRVVDFTRVLAGPHCTKALRDLGAQVIKIEPPSGDIVRIGLPHVGDMGMYFAQQNAGKRSLSLDLNWSEAREVAVEICRTADVIVENFRPGTLKRFGLSYEDVRQFNPKVVYASLSGYGQSTSWSNRPAFAVTVQAETGLTSIVEDHFGGALSEPMNDACSHADIYTGLQGVIGILAALQHRNRTGEGQHIDVSMAATMLSVNERAGSQLSGIDTNGEPIALSANESHIFKLPDGNRLTIAASPIFSPMFARYCAMMRRNDLLSDPRYATANLRREHLSSLLEEVRVWLLTFTDLQELQAQVSEAGLACGMIRTVNEFAKSEWVKEMGGGCRR
ncbi:CaiB/BaiF CoA transferase family protein [Bradyrhizobium sp. AZCC 2289]|uniref:CaiB/BaiF CoA transferase family protein n=1 Tax=Bradyrhizobium sp. AZCC 2289 TaxID=3117026 RepID=UPI002FF3EFB0